MVYQKKISMAENNAFSENWSWHELLWMKPPPGSTLFNARWVYGHLPLHSPGYLLDPELIDPKQWEEKTLMTDFLSIVTKFGVLKKVREIPTNDREQAKIDANHEAVV